jgi:hypothetical protein
MAPPLVRFGQAWGVFWDLRAQVVLRVGGSLRWCPEDEQGRLGCVSIGSK